MNAGQKTSAALITKAPGSAGTFILSSSVVDRDQDVITPKALKAATEKTKTLLCLWQHDRSQPIGVWEKLRVDAGKLLGDLRLSATNLGQMVKQLLDDDIPLSSSIGFMGSGTFNDFGGISYHDIELLECSVVSVPANPQAVRIAKSFGFDIQSSDEKAIKAMSGLSASQDAIAEARRAIARLNIQRMMK